MKSIKYFLAILFFVINFFTVPFIASAGEVDHSTAPLNFTPEISIPNSGFTNNTPIEVGKKVNTVIGNTTTVVMSSDLIGKYIQALYNYGLAIAAILAAIVLMGGGLVWLTSGGDSGKINKAKEMIIGSISGMIILFCAWIILNTVNPALLELKPINTTLISKVVIGCCDKAKVSGKAEMTSNNNCADGSAFSENKKLNALGVCDTENCCFIKSYSNGYPEHAELNLCVDIIKSTCDEIAKVHTLNNYGTLTYIAEFKDKTCSNFSECTDKVMSCVGKDDATNLISKSTGGHYWCYDEKAYFGDKGKIGEPCGNEPYSKCSSDYFNNTADLGGRSCCDATTPGCEIAVCNKYKSDGSKK